MQLALFDFDGTITKKDSMIHFLIHYKGIFVFLMGLLWLSPTLVLWKLGIIETQRAKEKLYRYFFSGVSEKEIYESGRSFLDKLENLINPLAYKRILEHKANGDRIVVVTASSEPWVLHWCQRNSLELICTQLVSTNGILTGQIDGKNCNGSEKVIRIKQYLDVKQFSKITAYGDSNGDKPMLELADEKFYKCL